MSRLEQYIQSNPQAVPSHIDVFELFRSPKPRYARQDSAIQGGRKCVLRRCLAPRKCANTLWWCRYTLVPCSPAINHVRVWESDRLRPLLECAEILKQKNGEFEADRPIEK